MKAINLYITVVVIITLLCSCVQETYKRTVHFEVDMTRVDGLESVGLRGDDFPLSWKQDFVMKDEDSSGIYQATVTFDTPFDYTQMKFVMNGGQYELRGSGNRKVYFNKEGETKYSAVFDVNESE